MGSAGRSRFRPHPAPPGPGRARVTTAAGLVALETDLLGLGYLVGSRLRAYLSGQSPERLAALGPADAPAPPNPTPGLAALVRGDVDLPGHAEVYALYPDRLDPDRLRVLQAGDLVAALRADNDDGPGAGGERR
ncbi:hypothetical protein ACNTMW_01480 [Planosporangium sp. 12N6]|uniref:hypothetical protein n=1 Tax=Planosporangium spinosum TaxID=3402278 RepID=UPI003CF23A52